MDNMLSSTTVFSVHPQLDSIQLSKWEKANGRLNQVVQLALNLQLNSAPLNHVAQQNSTWLHLASTQVSPIPSSTPLRDAHNSTQPHLNLSTQLSRSVQTSLLPLVEFHLRNPSSLIVTACQRVQIQISREANTEPRFHHESNTVAIARPVGWVGGCFSTSFTVASRDSAPSAALGSDDPHYR